MLVLMLGRGRGEAPEQGGATHAAAGAAGTVAYGASFHGLLFQRAMGGSAWPAHAQTTLLLLALSILVQVLLSAAVSGTASGGSDAALM